MHILQRRRPQMLPAATSKLFQCATVAVGIVFIGFNSCRQRNRISFHCLVIVMAALAVNVRSAHVQCIFIVFFTRFQFVFIYMRNVWCWRAAPLRTRRLFRGNQVNFDTRPVHYCYFFCHLFRQKLRYNSRQREDLLSLYFNPTKIAQPNCRHQNVYSVHFALHYTIHQRKNKNKSKYERWAWGGVKC